MYQAALQAKKEGISEISVIEFGVAGGTGLVAMQKDGEAIESATGIGVRVYGFDMGSLGLPEFTGDFRDHPDIWQPGDFPMDESALRTRLTSRTTLILGNLRDTAPRFFSEYSPPPVGFVAVDVDLYSSTADALKLFLAEGARMLLHVPMYFDDIEFVFNHKFAGELLAIEEFNRNSRTVKIDRWYGVSYHRPFPERPYLDRMYVAHNISRSRISVEGRPRANLPLRA